MTFTTLAVSLYVVSAVLAVVMTLREQRLTGGRPLVVRVAGVLACALWPLTAAVMIIALNRRAT